MSTARAVRYRRLALAEQDRRKANLLNQLADEADRGVLCTADWMSNSSIGATAKPNGPTRGEQNSVGPPAGAAWRHATNEKDTKPESGMFTRED